jgi:hypothetical protein
VKRETDGPYFSVDVRYMLASRLRTGFNLEIDVEIRKNIVKWISLQSVAPRRRRRSGETRHPLRGALSADLTGESAVD